MTVLHVYPRKARRGEGVQAGTPLYGSRYDRIVCHAYHKFDKYERLWADHATCRINPDGVMEFRYDD